MTDEVHEEQEYIDMSYTQNDVVKDYIPENELMEQFNLNVEDED